MSAQSEEKSSLYEIYEDDELTDSTDEIYKELESNIHKSTKQQLEQATQQQLHEITLAAEPFIYRFLKVAGNLAILVLLGNIYNQLSIHLTKHYKIEPSSLPIAPEKSMAVLLNHIIPGSTAQRYVIHGVQGILLGLVVPLFDRITAKRSDGKTVGAKVASDQSTLDAAGLIRPLVAILGLLFAIRKIEWISTFQLAVIWTVLNGGLWGVIDGSVSILCYALGLIAYGLGVNGLNSLNAEAAVVADYWWFGALLFGVVGRALF